MKKIRFSSDNMITKISTQEKTEANRIYKQLQLLGIDLKYDSKDTLDKDLIPCNYRNINEYESDKYTALFLITENKEVPIQLRNKLITTKNDLEQRKATI